MSANGTGATLPASVETVDGIGLQARWWMPSVDRGTAVVIAHGFTGSKDDPRLVAVADTLREAGHVVLAYDARGHHGSGGMCTLGDLERYDVGAAVTAARTRAARVVTVGASMGAIATLRYAAGGDPCLAGAVAVSSPARWRFPRNARTLLAAGITRTRVGRRYASRRLHVRIAPHWNDPEPPHALAARVGVPLAVVHGERDRFIRPREAVELAASARFGRLFFVPEMGHAFDVLAVPAIVAAVGWVLADPTAVTDPSARSDEDRLTDAVGGRP